MAARVIRPRPATKHGLASDVRSGTYATRKARTAKREPPKPKAARTPKGGDR